ncbi:MAG: C39 family peptidase [Alphaproteobacteria bacterium]
MPRIRSSTAVVIALAGAFALADRPAAADALLLANAGGLFNVSVTSYKDQKFTWVVRQEHDFSCGSAAVATLLTHHYGSSTTEDEVFREMIAHGDPERIRTQGFSMADMKNYLVRRGFQAGGYQAPLDILLKAGVPGIVLINSNGYMHFVVVKGLTPDWVLVGDPAVGLGLTPRAEFEAMWSGVMFVILDHDREGREYFNHARDWGEWHVRPTMAAALARGMNQDLSSFLLTLRSTDYFHHMTDMNVFQRVF